jgi:hypothetical protein
MRRYIWSALLLCAILSAAIFAPPAEGQTPDDSRPYDALTAGAESYWYHEAQRRRDIDRQLGLIGRFRERVWFGGGDIFEPWPIVAGDIWGYPFFDPIPQPIGQRQIQTGPNRWESHPVYAAPAGPLPIAPPPAADRPGGGPREF